MTYCLKLLTLISLLLCQPAIAITVLCYHDVKDNAIASYSSHPDKLSLDTRDLVAHFEMLRVKGYTPISLQHWRDAREGKRSLPNKPVLLTFDDGLRSVHDRVLPLLKLYQYPAVAAIVTSWIAPESKASDPKRQHMTKAELLALANSGLVELASHTHALHHEHDANPQGNQQPAAISRLWSTNGYESQQQYALRLQHDLEQSRVSLESITGTTIDTIIWPYGAFNDEARNAARAAGFQIAMGLGHGHNRDDAKLTPMALQRHLISITTAAADLAETMESTESPIQALGSLRALKINPAIIYDADPVIQEERLSELIARLYQLKVNTVVLEIHDQYQAWYPSNILPMRSDILNRISWQIRSRVGAKVFLELSPCGSQSLQQLAVDVAPWVWYSGAYIANSNDTSDLRKAFSILQSYQPDFIRLSNAEHAQHVDIVLHTPSAKRSLDEQQRHWLINMNPLACADTACSQWRQWLSAATLETAGQ